MTTIDPKPQLGSAAIQCNIDYYQAIALKHFELFTEASNEAARWSRELELLQKNNS